MRYQAKYQLDFFHSIREVCAAYPEYEQAQVLEKACGQQIRDRKVEITRSQGYQHELKVLQRELKQREIATQKAQDKVQAANETLQQLITKLHDAQDRQIELEERLEQVQQALAAEESACQHDGYATPDEEFATANESVNKLAKLLQAKQAAGVFTADEQLILQTAFHTVSTAAASTIVRRPATHHIASDNGSEISSEHLEANHSPAVSPLRIPQSPDPGLSNLTPFAQLQPATPPPALAPATPNDPYAHLLLADTPLPTTPAPPAELPGPATPGVPLPGTPTTAVSLITQPDSSTSSLDDVAMPPQSPVRLLQEDTSWMAAVTGPDKRMRMTGKQPRPSEEPTSSPESIDSDLAEGARSPSKRQIKRERDKARLARKAEHKRSSGVLKETLQKP